MTRNIAEGFGRYRHKEFAQFLSFARGSAFELADCLKDGVSRGYWTKGSTEDAAALCDRTIKALTRLINYLRENPDI